MPHRTSGSSKKLRVNRTPTLEQLEARLTFSIDAISESLAMLLDSDSLPSVAAQAPVKNQPPTFVKSPNSITQVASNRTTLSVLGKDDSGEAKLTYRWQVISAPQGSSVAFSANNTNAAKNTSLAFNRAGQYTIGVSMNDAAGLRTTANYRVNVVPTVTKLIVQNQNNQTLASGAKLTTSGVNSSLKVIALDQFGQKMTLPSSVTWTSSSATRDAKATVQSRGESVTVAFNRAADYQIRVTSGKLSSVVNISVTQTLKSISVTPGTSTAQAASSMQFKAQGLDQFKNPLLRQPSFTWSASSGSINSSGLWQGTTQPGNVEIKAVSGGVTGKASVSVAQPSGGGGDFQNPGIAGLVQTYFADGSITRPEMIQILRSAGIDGSVDTTELTDLRNLVANASKYKIPDYVRVLADDVVNGNRANATYQGAASGNLAVGSSGAQLNLLVDKWFYGTDRPTLTNSNLSYRVASGNLFTGSPNLLDQRQGALGDCYFISTLGIIAAKTPDAIRNMFIDNQDGTFTVRFFTGIYGAFTNSDGSISDGFRTGSGAADYVTVDKHLAANANGTFAYSNAGSALSATSNSLWIALAEKAYAQWNATGKSGRSVVANTYASIEGGWMSTVNSQVLGYNASNYSLATTAKQKLIEVLNSGQAVTIGTKGSASNGLVGSHAYSIVGYNAQSDQFQLHNPWGSSHPGGLTYSQLQANCTYFVVADPSRFISNPVNRVASTVRGEQDMAPAVSFEVVQRTSTTSQQRLDEPSTLLNTELSTVPTANPASPAPQYLVLETPLDDASEIESAEQLLETIDQLFGELAENERLFAS